MQCVKCGAETHLITKGYSVCKECRAKLYVDRDEFNVKLQQTAKLIQPKFKMNPLSPFKQLVENKLTGEMVPVYRASTYQLLKLHDNKMDIEKLLKDAEETFLKLAKEQHEEEKKAKENK